ncbi:hypothetical protein PINS_up011039 [Pythium insidiosum]|nr:hypothetical protein PINS_up011039 [Pythium insidiosum]
MTTRDLAFRAVDAEQLHPLKSAAISATPMPRSRPPKAEETKEPVDHVEGASSFTDARAKQQQHQHQQPEVVVLEEGELDPLGVLTTLSLEGEKKDSVKAAASVETDNRWTGNAATSGGVTAAMANAGDAEPKTIKQMWTAHKERVLSKFSDETFKIKASMLEMNDIESDISYTSTAAYHTPDDPIADGIHAVRKTRTRLEQLERGTSSESNKAPVRTQSSSNADKTVEITQEEYIARIKQLEADLVKAWKQNHKVLALRLAIKCVKQLSDTSSAPQLYPCAFVLVSGVLDVFGGLVFERIKTRASEDDNGQPLPTPLSEHFSSAEVNIHAKETCRNWFYKTACIRELLPRIYIEIALLKSYRFLCDGEYPQIVARLSNMIKGVGEPMVALYTWLYLALASSELVGPGEKAAVLSSLYDYFFTFQQYQNRGKLSRYLSAQGMSNSEYLSLHSPAVEWLMKCAAFTGDEFLRRTDDGSIFDVLLAHYREFSDNSMVLKHLCEAFPPECSATNPFMIRQLMRTSTPSQFSKSHLYSVLALQLSKAKDIAGGGKQEKLQFLNDAWESITAQEDIEQYMECAAAYMKLIVAHYTHREAMILLKDVVRHLNAASPEELTSRVYNLLGAFIENIVFGAQLDALFFSRIIPSGEFLALMGMFRREASVNVAKKVLQAFVVNDAASSDAINSSTSQPSTSNDKSRLSTMRLHVVGPEAAVAHTLFVLSCRIHDALDSLSTAGERADATRDITAFITRLGYVNGSNTSETKLQEEEEALLVLYTDCRSAFYKLENIKVTLTRLVIALAARVSDRIHRRVGPNSAARLNDRRRSFVQSCLAYAFITIPSISSPVKQRLELQVLCAKVALINNSLPQTEAFLRAAIVLVAELDVVSFLTGNEEETANRLHTSSISDLSTRRQAIGSVLGDLISVLVYAPSLQDDEPFFFVNAFKKAIADRVAWDSPSAAARIRLAARACRVDTLIKLQQLLGLWGQPKLPNRLVGVESNDVLFGGDEAFSQRVQASFSATTEEIVRDIESLATDLPSSDTSAAQAELMMQFVEGVLPYVSFDEEEEPQPNADTAPTRRRGRSRSGSKLLRKCVMYVYEKLSALGVPEDRESGERERVAVLRCTYGSVLQHIGETVELQRKRAMLLSAAGKQGLEQLDECLRTLVL